MLQKKFFIFIIFVSLMFLHGIVSNSGQTQQAQLSNSNVQPFTDLSFEINIPTQDHLRLQPIPLILKLSNRTNRSVLGYSSIGFGGYPLYLYVQKIGSENKVLIQPLTTISGSSGVINSEVPAGVSYEAKELITIGLNKYFPERGTYELQAVLFNADRTQSIESNVSTIEIQEPSGINRNVYNLIKDSSFQDYLFSGVEFKKVKNTLELITTRFPNSSYAKNSCYLLGEIYFYDKQYPKALNNLLRLENDSDFIFADKVKSYLAEIRRLPQEQQINEEKP
jgi:hypothetical protein